MQPNSAAPFSQTKETKEPLSLNLSSSENLQADPKQNRASVLVVFYSILGHTYDLALAEAEGARSVKGVHVDIRRVKEILDKEELKSFGGCPEIMKRWEHIPIVKTEEIVKYDAIIFGTPVHFGLMSIQMKAFINSLMVFWEKNELTGKLAGFFSSSGSQRNFSLKN
jgi:NAD(P)H dehydrogenase (quinone)